MKTLPLFFLVLGVALTARAAQPSPEHANNRTIPKAHISTPTTTGALAPISSKPSTDTTPPTPSASTGPATGTAAKSSVTLDAYLAALASDVPLTKDEQTDVKAYYQDDGAKLQGILNDASLSPFEQTEQVDALRDSRNAKIEALLNDLGRQSQFLKLESTYRVALVEIAAQGGLVPGSPPPKVPEPTATTPAQAEKPGT